MEFQLFFHILGAMVLVGSLVFAAITLVRGGVRGGNRTAMRALLLGALPAWIVMRVFAQLLADGAYGGAELQFIEIGYMVAEPGLVLLLGAALATWLAGRRGADGPPTTASRIALALVSISVVAYVVVIWAMTTKPV